jgi:hypothetical protein
MTQATDTDLRELRDLILGLDKKLDGLDKKVDVYIAQNTEQLKGLETRLVDFKKGTEIQISDLKKGTETQISDLKKGTETQISDLKKGMDTQLSDIKIQLRAQDTRLWGFIVTLSLAIIGFLSKLAFFPQT